MAEDSLHAADQSCSGIAVAGPLSLTDLPSPSTPMPAAPVAGKPHGPRVQKRRREHHNEYKNHSEPSRYPKYIKDLKDNAVGTQGRRRNIDQAFDRIRYNIGRRFDRRFVEFETTQDQNFKAAIRLVQGNDKHPGVFDPYLQAIRESRREKTEQNPLMDPASLVLAAAFDDIAEELQPGEKDKGYFLSRAQHYPLANPNLNFAPGHGIQGTDDQWDGVKPDMIVWKYRRDRLDRKAFDLKEDWKVTEYDWEKFAAVGEIKLEKTSDMRTTGTPFQASLTQVMNYMGILAFENPVTGSTCGFTVCGGYMRVVLNDSLSCSTARLCNLGNPDHAEDIVKMIVFLIGPLQAVLDTYVIPTGEFGIESDDGEKTVTKYRWVPDDEGVKWKILERRHDLHGRRTVAINGKARKIGRGAPIESLTIKFTWLPGYLVHYEQLILLKLARATEGTANPDNTNLKLAEAIRTVKKEILEYGPRSIGMLAGCERRTRESPARCGIDDGLSQSSPGSHAHLVLSGMCTVNPVGTRVSTLSKLSWKQRLQILSGAFASLWIAACSDVHYRDVNIGNVLYALLDEKSGEVVGYRDHFSDSIAHRIHAKTGNWLKDIQLRLDDARSINPWFISTHLADVLYEEARWQRLLDDKIQKDWIYELNPTSREAKENAQQATEVLEEAEQELANMSEHRYIDDMESLVYVHIYQTAELIGEVDRERRGQLIFTFDNVEVKKVAWSNNLRNTLESLLNPDLRWRHCLSTIVKKIRQARSFEEATGGVSASLTEREHECFRKCLEILKQAQANALLGTEPVSRPEIEL